MLDFFMIKAFWAHVQSMVVTLTTPPPALELISHDLRMLPAPYLDCTATLSLVPRPFLRGRGKTAWAPLLAHARRSHKNMGIRARLYIVRLHISNLP